MANNTIDKEQAKSVARNNRINHYIDFLKLLYGVELDGLAQIVGYTEQELSSFYRANLGNKSVYLLADLARLSGISLDFLLETDWIKDKNELT